MKDSALPESMMLESALKPKEFHMPPISVEEAVENLSYIDHPFYVFRNKVSLLYCCCSALLQSLSHQPIL